MAGTSPIVNIVKQTAITTSSLQEMRILFIGQKLSGGTAIAGELIENIGNAGQEDTLFGARSMLASMIRAAKLVNKDTRIDVIPLADDGSAVKATATDVLSGTASAAGTITYTIGSSLKCTYVVDIASGDAEDTIGPKVVSKVNADTRGQVIASYSAGSNTLTFTYQNGGLEGNFSTISIVNNVAGVTHTLTGFAGGTTNPTLTSVFDPIDDMYYQFIVWPTSYDVATLNNFLISRYNTNNKILNARAIIHKFDSLVNLVTLNNLYNSGVLNFWESQLVSETLWKGDSIFEYPHVVSSIATAVIAKLLTEGAQISDLVGATASILDRFGGPALASRPFFNTPFVTLPTIAQRHKFIEAEVIQLKDSGGTVFVNNANDTYLTIRDAVTTYKTDLAGNPDVSLKFLNYELCLSIAAEVFFRDTKAQFSQNRLSKGDLVGGRDGVNEESFSAFLDSVYLKLASEDWMMVDGDPAAIQFFKENKVILIDYSLGELASDLTMSFMRQARRFDITIRPTFDI
jgi:phage tail sheath gpL-like